MKQTWGVVIIKATGNKVIVHMKQVWGKIYYSFDGENWSDKKSKALEITTKLSEYKIKGDTYNEINHIH